MTTDMSAQLYELLYEGERLGHVQALSFEDEEGRLRDSMNGRVHLVTLGPQTVSVKVMAVKGTRDGERLSAVLEKARKGKHLELFEIRKVDLKHPSIGKVARTLDILAGDAGDVVFELTHVDSSETGAAVQATLEGPVEARKG